MFDLKKDLRTVNASNIARITIEDIAMELNPTSVRLTHHKLTNKDYVHFVTEDGYLSVGLGKSVTLKATKADEAIQELLDDYVIYTGVNENNQRWYTFGKEGELTATEEFAFSGFKFKVNA